MIVSFWSIFHSKRGWFDIGEIVPMSMDECEPRLLRAGLPQLHDNRKSAVFLILLMFISIAQPVNANNSISRDDFDVLDALMETLSMREENGEAEIANSLAENALSAVDAAARPVGENDPLTVANKFLDNVSMRDSSPYEVDHPRPYEFLMDRSTQPEGFPDNLFDTLFSTAALGNGDILAIGINTYAVYVNFTSRNNGPSYEAWERGTFTGELIVDGQITLFDNYIDIDGDGSFNHTLSELKTLVEYNLPVKVAIMNDKSLSMVRVWEELFFEERYTATASEKNPDYVKLAQSYGIKAICCDSYQDLPDMVGYFLEYSGPIVADFRVEKDRCLPLVAPGKGLDEMILPETQTIMLQKNQYSIADVPS